MSIQTKPLFSLFALLYNYNIFILYCFVLFFLHVSIPYYGCIYWSDCSYIVPKIKGVPAATFCTQLNKCKVF